MEILTQKRTYPFLEGGGEMGERTRNFDWSQTVIGTPDQWPQSLRTTVAMILSSKFPMFLWWGEDMIQFYNDAYRPSLGNEGKHPQALGQKAEDCWPEIWDIIYPLIQQVQTTGEATWSEDQLVPIYRNGKLENVYWTFGYSPVRGDSDKIEGVLVVCTETTEKVTNFKRLQESEVSLRKVTDTVPAVIWITEPDGTCTYLNKQWYDLTGQTEEEAEGFGWLNATHPDDKEEAGILFIGANEKQIPFSALYRLRQKDGSYRWAIDKGSPKFSADGVYEGMIGTVVDVHDQKLAEEKIKESETKLSAVIAAAPVGIGLFIGRDLVIEMPNQTFIDIVGKGPDIEGKPLREAMPELLTENQPFLQILDDVYTSGKMFQSFGSQVKILQNGVMTDNYYNITYTPLFDEGGNVYGILDIAVDVTEQVIARKKIEQSGQNLRNMILQAPVAMCILKGVRIYC